VWIYATTTDVVNTVFGAVQAAVHSQSVSFSNVHSEVQVLRSRVILQTADKKEKLCLEGQKRPFCQNEIKTSSSTNVGIIY
jgi:hypothetical protein